MPKLQPKNAQDLAREIEGLIAEFLAERRAAVGAAVQRALASTPVRGRPRALPAENASRRTPDEMTALSDRLCAAICATPGEAMIVLPAVGSTPRALNRPAVHLKRAAKDEGAVQRAGPSPRSPPPRPSDTSKAARRSARRSPSRHARSSACFPRDLSPKGFVQDTFGAFEKSFLDASAPLRCKSVRRASGRTRPDAVSDARPRKGE